MYAEGTDAFELVEESTDELLVEYNKKVAAKWARLLRKYWGARRQQLIFNSSGRVLQNITQEARDRVSRMYPIER